MGHIAWEKESSASRRCFLARHDTGVRRTAGQTQKKIRSEIESPKENEKGAKGREGNGRRKDQDCAVGGAAQ